MPGVYTRLPAAGNLLGPPAPWDWLLGTRIALRGSTSPAGDTPYFLKNNNWNLQDDSEQGVFQATSPAEHEPTNFQLSLSHIIPCTQEVANLSLCHFSKESLKCWS